MKSYGWKRGKKPVIIEEEDEVTCKLVADFLKEDGYSVKIIVDPGAKSVSTAFPQTDCIVTLVEQPSLPEIGYTKLSTKTGTERLLRKPFSLVELKEALDSLLKKVKK